MTILVPRGAEATAVRRARPAARIVALAPGAASAGAVPQFAPGEIAVVLGLCGALGERRVGDVVVYASVGNERGSFALDEALATALARALAGFAPSSGPAAGGVPIVAACTADHVVTTSAERRALAHRSGAAVVDMEGTYLAAALSARGVRHAMVRVVSDDAARDLPALASAIQPDGRLDPVRIARAFVRAPRGAALFVRDVGTALATLGRVTHAVGGADVPASKTRSPS